MIENLRKDRTFRLLDDDVIDEYRQTVRGRRRRRRQPRKHVGVGQLPPLQSMTVHVAKSSFTPSEEARIRQVHPEWKWFLGWIAPMRTLDRGEHLEIDAIGRDKRFTISRYLEHDRVRGVGVIAHVRAGKFFPLKRLAAKLEVSQRSLLSMRRLDIYGIALAKRAFPKAFG